MKDESSDFYVPCHGVFCQAFIFPHIYFNPIKLYDFVLDQIWVPISYSIHTSNSIMTLRQRIIRLEFPICRTKANLKERRRRRPYTRLLRHILPYPAISSPDTHRHYKDQPKRFSLRLLRKCRWPLQFRQITYNWLLGDLDCCHVGDFTGHVCRNLP